MILNNLLNQALTIIPGQEGQLHKWVGKITNDVGTEIDQYASPTPIYGSFQAVPRTLFEKMGLDYKKVYYMLFTSQDVQGLSRTNSGDRITYTGKTLKLETEGGWKPVDGWTGVLMVEVPND